MTSKLFLQAPLLHILRQGLKLLWLAWTHSVVQADFELEILLLQSLEQPRISVMPTSKCLAMKPFLITKKCNHSHSSSQSTGISRPGREQVRFSLSYSNLR